MKIRKYLNINRTIGALLLLGMMLSSCEKYVDIDASPDKVSVDVAYSTNASATSAVLALYSYYYTTNTIGYFTYLGSLAADDLQYTGTTSAIQEFGSSTVTTSNSYLLNYLWAYPYAVIGETNNILEGLNASTTLSDTTKNRLLGEAKFFRAFYYFNLVNYFGGVPLVLNSSTFTNTNLARSTEAETWAQIITDLKDAQALLPVTYISNLRARVNKYAATALLARAYLYTKDYENAATEASKVINATDVTYILPALGSAFLNTSSEVILQFATLYGYSHFGSNYRTSAVTSVPTYVLYDNFVNSFETGDNRKTSWVDSVTTTKKYYKINKYKLVTATAGNEYDVVLRLAEQYLIRAESRAQLNDLTGSQDDLNAVRKRAGLGTTNAATQIELLAAVTQERKVELFGEFSHRWFDLKRTGQADAIIGALKPTTWKSTAVLMPIPQSEITTNPNLEPNPGYN